MSVSRHLFLLLGSAAGTLSSVRGGGYSLVENSPFIPPDFNPPSAPVAVRPTTQQASQYTYRGVYQLGQTLFFNIFNASENKAQWIRGDATDNSEIRILDYDLAEDEIEIEISGQTLSLSLAKPSDQPIPVQTQTAQRPAAVPAAPAAAPAGPANTTATEERPVRRRVIRPTTRSTPAITPERRPVMGQ